MTTYKTIDHHPQTRTIVFQFEFAHNNVKVIPDTIGPCVRWPIFWVSKPPATAGPQISRVVPPDEVVFERVLHFRIDKTVEYRHHKALIAHGNKSMARNNNFYRLQLALEDNTTFFFMFVAENNVCCVYSFFFLLSSSVMHIKTFHSE